MDRRARFAHAQRGQGAHELHPVQGAEARAHARRGHATARATRATSTRSRPEQEPPFPGDESDGAAHPPHGPVERRGDGAARRTSARPGIGGHLSTYASSASLYEVGFNHFFRGKDDGQSGDQIFFQGHGAPGVYARAFLEGRFTEKHLDHFRREVAGLGAFVVSAPAAHARFLGVPDGVDGARAADCDYQARFNRYLHARGIKDTTQLARVGVRRRRRDGRARIDFGVGARGTRGTRQPDVRRELQPPAARRTGARQRQDHPGARERSFRGAGWNVIKVIWSRDWDSTAGERRRRRAGEQDERDARRRMAALLRRERRVHPRALLRARRTAQGARRAPARRDAPQAAPRRPRLPEGLRGVQGGDRARGAADGDPREDREGLDARRRNGRPQHHAPDEASLDHRHEVVPRPARAADPRFDSSTSRSTIIPGRRARRSST